MKKILLFLFLTFGFSQVSTDNVFSGTHTSALAGAITSSTKIQKSFQHNPAVLAEINQQFLRIDYSNLYNVNFLENQLINGFIKFSTIGSFGFHIEQTSVKYLTKKMSTEQLIGFSKGYTLQKDRNSTLLLGVSLNYFLISFGKSAGVNGDGSNGSLEKNTGSEIGVDLGVLATLRDKYRFGAFFKNLNAPQIGDGISSQYLPQRLSLAVTYIPIDELSTTFEIENELGKSPQVQAGIEYQLHPSFLLMVGIQSNPNRMGMGFSYEQNGIEISWSILSHQILPTTQSFSIGYSF
jgi:hypothetical protein